MFFKNPLLEFLYTFFLVLGVTIVVTCLFGGLLRGVWVADMKLALSLAFGIGIYSAIGKWIS